MREGYPRVRRHSISVEQRIVTVRYAPDPECRETRSFVTLDDAEAVIEKLLLDNVELQHTCRDLREKATR